MEGEEKEPNYESVYREIPWVIGLNQFLTVSDNWYRGNSIIGKFLCIPVLQGTSKGFCEDEMSNCSTSVKD